MQDLQLPTLPVSVEVFTTDFESLTGRLFVAESPYRSGVPEEIEETLNDERRFLPLGQDDPDAPPLCLNKRCILWVRLVDSERRCDPTASGDACELAMADGSKLRGQLDVDTPRDSSRLVDKLNHGAPFIALVTESGTVYVQRGAIVRARSLGSHEW